MEMLRYPRKIAIGFQEGTCPLSCKKCLAFNGEKPRKKIGKMTIDNAKKIIDEIVQFDNEVKIQPHIFTEPFANKELKDIIRYCNKVSHGKLGMSIITNGILIDEEWEKFILSELNENYTISFSLDAVSQEVYELVRGKYNLVDIEEKILRLVSKRKGNAPRIIVNYTMEHDNEKETKIFLDKWKYKVDAVGINVCLDRNRKVPLDFRNEIREEYIPCPKTFDVMTIDWNGDVRTCQVDAFGETDLGNVFEEGVLNVWNGVLMNQIRQKQIDNQLQEEDYCYGCEFKYVSDLDKEIDNEDFIIKRGSCIVFYNRK